MSLTQHSFILMDRSKETDGGIEVLFTEIVGILDIPTVQSNLSCSNDQFFYFMMHTSFEDRGRLFRFDSREERDYWFRLIERSVKSKQKELESEEWKSLNTHEKIFFSVEKVHKNPRTSIVMCGFVVIDFLFTCLDKQFDEEQLGPHGVQVSIYFFSPRPQLT